MIDLNRMQSRLRVSSDFSGPRPVRAFSKMILNACPIARVPAFSGSSSWCRRQSLQSMAKPSSTDAIMNHCKASSKYQRVEKRRCCINGGLASVAAFRSMHVRKEFVSRR